MSEIVGGILMVLGGGMLSASSVGLVRAQSRFSAELMATLQFTPLPPPDPTLDALVAQLD